MSNQLGQAIQYLEQTFGTRALLPYIRIRWGEREEFMQAREAWICTIAAYRCRVEQVALLRQRVRYLEGYNALFQQMVEEKLSLVCRRRLQPLAKLIIRSTRT